MIEINLSELQEVPGVEEFVLYFLLLRLFKCCIAFLFNLQLNCVFFTLLPRLLFLTSIV